MSPELAITLLKARELLQLESHPHCVAVNILFNSQGYEITSTLRSPASLKRDGVSMRNMQGDWVIASMEGDWVR